MGTTLRYNSSGHRCGACDDVDLRLGQEIYCLRVNRIYENEEGVFLYDDLDENGDFVYPPYFLCVPCWESDSEDLFNTLHGVPAAEAHPHLRQCDVCQSSILSGELIGLLESGAFHLDERQPEGTERTVMFLSAGDPYYICTHCLNVLNVEVREYWENDIRNGGECPEGLEERCWRTGECEHCCKYDRAYQWASENTTLVLTPSKG